ncbi:MAG: hypothetical protein K2X98_01040 [Alphaproteobacteria bacterium]|nr:hypothetical protein [Alphaproteobacteria bacterium]
MKKFVFAMFAIALWTSSGFCCNGPNEQFRKLDIEKSLIRSLLYQNFDHTRQCPLVMVDLGESDAQIHYFFYPLTQEPVIGMYVPTALHQVIFDRLKKAKMDSNPQVLADLLNTFDIIKQPSELTVQEPDFITSLRMLKDGHIVFFGLMP